MGTILIGKQSIEAKDLMIKGNLLTVDGKRTIELCDSDKRPIQVCGNAVFILKLITDCELLLKGGIDSAKSNRNILVVGKIDRCSYGNSRFFNNTAHDSFIEAKSACSKKSPFGSRLKVKITGDFNQVKVYGYDDIPTEIFIDGHIVRATSSKDILVKGRIDGSRSELNTYISSK